MSPRKGARQRSQAVEAGTAAIPGVPAIRNDPAWPWAVGAIALWALIAALPRSEERTLTEAALVIAAVAATVATALVLARRNTNNVAQAAATAAVAALEAHQAAAARQASSLAAPRAAPPGDEPAPPQVTPSRAPASAPQSAPARIEEVSPAAPPAAPRQEAPPMSRPVPPPAAPPLVAKPADAPPPPPPAPAAAEAAPVAAPSAEQKSRKGELLRPCPCGFCETQVEDANGYLTSVTAWVIAVERLCKQASEAMVKGGWVHLPVYEFASDTEALKELLVQTCHEGGGTRAIWTIQGLVTVWEQTLFRVEQEIAATVEPGRYLAWHTATADIRANRHGD